MPILSVGWPILSAAVTDIIGRYIGIGRTLQSGYSHLKNISWKLLAIFFSFLLKNYERVNFQNYTHFLSYCYCLSEYFLHFLIFFSRIVADIMENFVCSLRNASYWASFPDYPCLFMNPFKYVRKVLHFILGK